MSVILYHWFLLLGLFLWNTIFTFSYMRVRPRCDLSIIGRHVTTCTLILYIYIYIYIYICTYTYNYTYDCNMIVCRRSQKWCSKCSECAGSCSWFWYWGCYQEDGQRYLCIKMYKYVYIYVYIYMYMYIYICIYTYTNTYKYMYTYIIYI